MVDSINVLNPVIQAFENSNKIFVTVKQMLPNKNIIESNKVFGFPYNTGSQMLVCDYIPKALFQKQFTTFYNQFFKCMLVKLYTIHFSNNFDEKYLRYMSYLLIITIMCHKFF